MAGLKFNPVYFRKNIMRTAASEFTSIHTSMSTVKRL